MADPIENWWSSDQPDINAKPALTGMPIIKPSPNWWDSDKREEPGTSTGYSNPDLFASDPMFSKGPSTVASFKEMGRGIPVAGRYITPSEDMLKFEKENPGSAQTMRALGGIASTAPLFMGAGALTGMAGEGLGEAANFGLNLAGQGATGAGINVADKIAEKGQDVTGGDLLESGLWGGGTSMIPGIVAKGLSPGVGALERERAEEIIRRTLGEHVEDVSESGTWNAAVKRAMDRARGESEARTAEAIGGHPDNPSDRWWKAALMAEAGGTLGHLAGLGPFGSIATAGISAAAPTLAKYGARYGAPLASSYLHGTAFRNMGRSPIMNAAVMQALGANEPSQ